MHEMGIALQVIEIAQSAIPDDYENPVVEKVHLRIGKLAAVVPESLRLCFEVASRDTPLEGAAVCIEDVPAVAECLSCGAKWEIEETVFSCVACGSSDINVDSGRELDITSIELKE